MLPRFLAGRSLARVVVVGAALVVASASVASDGRDGRRGLSRSHSGHSYRDRGHSSHGHRGWSSYSHGHSNHYGHGHYNHYRHVRYDDCGPSFIFRFDARPIVIERPVVCEPPIIYRRTAVYETPVVIHQPAPVIVQQPAPVIVQQPAPVVVQEQPAVVVAQPAPVVYEQNDGRDVVPADLQIAAYQSQDRVIIMLGGVNRAAGFSTSITSLSSGSAVPELLLRNMPPQQEVEGETPFTLNAAIRSKNAIQTLRVRVADQVFEVPVIAVPSIS